MVCQIHSGVFKFFLWSRIHHCIWDIDYLLKLIIQLGFHHKVTCIRASKETIKRKLKELNTFYARESMIFATLDQIKVYRVPLWIEHAFLFSFKVNGELVKIAQTIPLVNNLDPLILKRCWKIYLKIGLWKWREELSWILTIYVSFNTFTPPPSASPYLYIIPRVL